MLNECNRADPKHVAERKRLIDKHREEQRLRQRQHWSSHTRHVASNTGSHAGSKPPSLKNILYQNLTKRKDSTPHDSTSSRGIKLTSSRPSKQEELLFFKAQIGTIPRKCSSRERTRGRGSGPGKTI